MACCGFRFSITMLVLLILLPKASAFVADSRRVNSPLVPFKLEPLQWGSVSPLGWLRDWAMAGRHGAVSPVHAAFANVQNGTVNGWRDGRPDSNGFWDEDSAYWIDGMTRMGLVLNDSVLVERVIEDFRNVVKNPINFHNTWINSHNLGRGSAEGWVRSVYSRGMLAYYDGTGNETILDFLVKSFSNYTAEDSQSDRSLTQIEALLEGHAYGGPKSMVDTALSMMETNPVSIEWMNQLSNNPDCLSAKALDDPNSNICMQHTHGVTFNEIAKLHAMAYSWNGNVSYLNTSLTAFNMMDHFDIQVHGVNSADEQLNGISPNLGTETCDISDFTYSNEWLLRITGNGRVHGDRLEKAFHNAAPGAINRTFTGHVYNQNPNLVYSSLGTNDEDRGGDFRWQTHWYHHPPCCTGNQARLLPNYIHHMWYGTPDGGLAVTMYGPNQVRFQLMSGRTVRIIETTDYPFEDTINFNFEMDSGAQETFPLLLRIPSWCSSPSIAIDGQHVPSSNISVDASGFVRLVQPWRHGSMVSITLPAEVRATKKVTFANGDSKHTWNPSIPWMGANATSNLPFCVVERGSLTFALPMEEDPKAPYGFAIDCDASTMKFSSKPLSKTDPWNWPLDAPMQVKVKARPFVWPDVWLMPKHAVGESETTGPVQELTLIPYGNAKVFHISMFPYLQ